MPPTNPLPRLLLVLALLWLATPIFAQRPLDYEVLSTDQGLSQGMIYDMLQDHEGFIWIGTKEGLNRYDGYSFKVFTYDPYDPNSISSNNIRTLFEDSKGFLWANSLDAGINIYDRKTGRFRRIMYQAGNPNGLSSNRVLTATLELPDGRVLLATEDNALTLISLPKDFFGKDSLPTISRVQLPDDARVYGIGKDDKGIIWVGCQDQRIYFFDARTKAFELVCDGRTFTSAVANGGTKIWSNREVLRLDSAVPYKAFDSAGQLGRGVLTRTPQGRVSFNTLGAPPTGIGESYYYGMGSWKPGMPVHRAVTQSLKGAVPDLQLVMVDSSGIVWMGTLGLGLRKYNLESLRFHHLCANLSVRNILPLGDDRLFVGGWWHDKWIKTNGEPVLNPLSRQVAVNYYGNFLVSRSGDYFILQARVDPTRPCTLYRYDPAGRKISELPVSFTGSEDKLPMLEDRRGNIWIGGRSGMLMKLNPVTGVVSNFNINTDPARPMLPNALTTTLYEDQDGVFWLGSEEGFARIQFSEKGEEKPVVTWYHNDITSNNSLSYNYVSCFLDDPSDSHYLWICTKGGGLNRLEKASGNFFHLTTKEGLPNEVVYGIVPDRAGNFWGSTNKGVFCLFLSKPGKKTKYTFRNFTKSDGLQGDEFNTAAFGKLPDGRLAFGGVNGLNIFDPAEILSAGYMPDVYITNFFIGNKAVAPRDPTRILDQTIEQTRAITLTNQQDILTLEFSALDFTAPLQNKYRYRMVGIDKDWVESGARRTATYLHLPAGDYTFEVQGSNSQGQWSEKTARLAITLLPPWWRSWWAYAFYAVLVVILVRTWFLFSVNRAKLRAQLNFQQMEADRVKELNTLKTQLYTNITHEFRTPLTVIMGMARQVIDHPQESFDHRMEMIIRNGQSLLNLVNEMLDLSKLEMGKMKLKPVNGDVINFLRYVVESFHSLAESQHKQLHFLTDLDTLYVAYDPEKLRQIIANLLSNALKFTPDGGNIYITAGRNVLPKDEPNLTLILKVRDTGLGIPEDQLQYIFDRFFQLDNSNTRWAEGTGIGLAVTKELVKLMEGEIVAKSPPGGGGKGSEFTVILPLVEVAPEAAEPAEWVYAVERTVVERKTAPVSGNPDPLFQQGNDERAPESPMILLVEDNADVVAYTASCLPGYRLSVGKDGQEGFEIATDVVPDLVITDVMMPGVDGYELCRRLRADERTSHIPIIMLTAKADRISKMEGLEQGADAWLEKPFHPEELQLRIRKLLELRRNLQGYYQRKAGITLSVAVAGKTPETSTEDAFVAKVRAVVESNLSNPDFTIEQLCKAIFMSHSQLHRKLDALTGYSPNKYIRVIRLSKAKQLLSRSGDPIASIALDCGYADPGYFGRVFKQETGLTPQDYRMQTGINDNF